TELVHRSVPDQVQLLAAGDRHRRAGHCYAESERSGGRCDLHLTTLRTRSRGLNRLRARRFVEEELHLAKDLESILLEEDEVGPFADLDEPPARSIGEVVEDRARQAARQ